MFFYGSPHDEVQQRYSVVSRTPPESFFLFSVVGMDRNDERIIRELQRDARKPIREIAKTVGLPASTVHVRIQRLQREGVIKRFTIEVDAATADEAFIAFVMTTAPPDPGWADDPHVREVFSITGDYTTLLKVRCKDFDTFSAWLKSFRHSYPVAATAVVTETVKEV